MRWFRWIFVGRHPARPSLGECLWCSSALELCPQCRGEWRLVPLCICRIGRTCPTHGRHWA